MFSAFPGGWPGVALLMVRAVVGAVAIAQGAAYLTAAAPSVASRVGGLLAVVSGASLVIGFFTPGAGAVVGLWAMAVAVFWVSDPSTFLQDPFATIFILTDTAAIALLGPGAFSLDARLFGRREIVIPHESLPSSP